VNVLPSPAPQDVYSAVTAEVEAVVRSDAADVARSEAVKLLAKNGGVDRKLVKQTVMTTVYGVTFVGAREQIAARLEERGWDNDSEVFQVRTA
jgi:DNA-directed RNA polymerase, mitochondrial